MSEDADLIVVGAGLAGLACAREAARRGLAVRVLEAGDGVGGRVRTDHVDGFTLDRGFQVLNTAYPELRAVADLDALDLRDFAPTVTIELDDRQLTLGNPLEAPGCALSLATLPVGGLGGKLATAAYALRCVTLPTSALKTRPDLSAAEAWRRAKIPTDVVNGVLRPFFSGVLLERDLTSSRRFTDLMMRMFARGRSTVPAGGMQTLPEQLAAGLGAGVLTTACPVREVTARRVGTDDGPLTARAVVVATDAWAAADLVKGFGGEPVVAPAPQGLTTVYHATPDFEGASPQLHLGAAESSVVNSIVLSRAAPTYAPAGRALVSTSLVHGSLPDDVDGPEVRDTLARLHRTDTTRWELVATYDIPHALPSMAAPHPLQRAVRIGAPDERVYVAGDHRDTSSIQGALVSGRRAADAVAEDLGAA